MVVGRGEVHLAALDRRLVVDVRDGKRRPDLQQAGQAAVDPVLPSVLRDHDGRVRVRRERREDLTDGAEASPGRADDDQLVVHETFFQSFSIGSISS